PGVCVRRALPRLQGTEDYDVAVVAVPNLKVRKHGPKSAQHEADDAIVHLVDMKPLGHDAAVLQLAGAHFVKFLAEDAADADGPRIGWLGDDHVVLLRAELQHGTRVFVTEMHARIGEHVTIIWR